MFEPNTIIYQYSYIRHVSLASYLQSKKIGISQLHSAGITLISFPVPIGHNSVSVPAHWSSDWAREGRLQARLSSQPPERHKSPLHCAGSD